MGENVLPRRPFLEEPSYGIIPEDTSSGKFPEDPSFERRFRDSGKNQEHFPEELHLECFWKKVLPEDNLLLPEGGSSEIFLKKKQ